MKPCIIYKISYLRFSVLMLNSVVLLASQLVGSPVLVASGEVSNHLFNNLAEEEGDTGNNLVTGLDKLHTCQVTY